MKQVEPVFLGSTWVPRAKPVKNCMGEASAITVLVSVASFKVLVSQTAAYRAATSAEIALVWKETIEIVARTVKMVVANFIYKVLLILIILL